MSGKPRTHTYKSMNRLVQRLRDDLNSQDFVLLFAYNGTGKTRLSMAFKDAGKKNGDRDTLYFNAYTEDLFHWDNDLDGDTERVLRINSDSQFFSGFKELALEEKIFAYLERYSDFDFKIDYENWTISFSKGTATHIKISRGEENIFIWCIYLAICELAIDGAEAYAWVKNLYIDDPISSLDDNNAIAVSSDLAKLLLQGRDRMKAVISSHHGLFFNVMCNELKKSTHKKYFLHSGKTSDSYTLRATDDTPFFHHVAMLSELQQAAESDKLYTHHFNMLRNILEKTATFFGFDDFSACIHGVDDEVLYARALNLLSHGKYSVYEPKEMVDDTKELFRNILKAFLDRYKFSLPELITNETKEVNES
jgi:hypothetical protein